jgi:hypothetical protein
MRGFNELSFSGDFPRGTYGRAIIDGTEYFVMVPELEMTHTPFGTEIRCPLMFDVLNKCDCCGRFDSRPTVLRSFSEAIAKGWFVLTSEFVK